MGLASQLVPILCLIGVVVLLSSITPAIKYVQAMHDFNMMAVPANSLESWWTKIPAPQS